MSPCIRPGCRTVVSRAVEKELGATRTDELAVMWDTFAPLRLTTAWREHDRPEYAFSWNPDKLESASDVGTPSADETVGSVVTGPPA